MMGRSLLSGGRLAMLLAVALLTALPAHAQEATSDDAARWDQLDSIAASPVASGKVTGLAAAVVRGSDTLLMGAYGLADVELDVAMPDDAVFEIGSVTKQFTAAAILRLEEAGKLNLDDPLTDYLPNYPLRGRRVTIRQLLNHTSGIRSYTETPGFGEIARQRLPRDSLVSLFADEPFDFDPGSAMIYNNSGYFLLGLIIEKLSGMSYEEYVETELFRPIGMDRSSYCSNSRLVDGRARGYTPGPDGTFLHASYLDHTWPYAAGSLCSTAGDMIAWLRALHGGEVVEASSYREMITPDTLADGHRLRYAMGLAVDEDAAGRAMIHHGGGIPGFVSGTRYYPQYDLSVVVLINTSGGAASPEAVAQALANRVLGDPGPPDAQAYPGVADELTGTFVGAARGAYLSVTIRLEDGGLVAVQEDEEDEVQALHHLADETFASEPGRYGSTTTFTFVRRRGRATELHLDEVAGHYVLHRVADSSARLWASRTPQTSMVEVDGHDVRIRTAAPHPRRRAGQPLVVLEAGSASTVSSWGPFIGEIARFAPVLAYDRAGIGESEWDGEHPTHEHIVGRLRRVLAEVGAEPPFVLVGHSFGGDIVRFFAEAYPEETVGLVLIDPPVHERNVLFGALEDIGAGEAEALELVSFFREGDDQPPGVRAEGRMLDDLLLDPDHSDFRLPMPSHIPVAVLVADADPGPEPEIYSELSFDVQRHADAWVRRKLSHLGDWILQVPEGHMTVVTGSGHFIHRDEPRLALEAVRSVVYPDIARALSATLQAEGPDAAVERYEEMKLWYPVHRFHEQVLNQLGYRLLRNGRSDDAIAIFQLNVREYPGAPNPYDSLADAYRRSGQLRLAAATWTRAIEVAEAADDARAEIYRGRLDEVRAELEGRSTETPRTR